MKILVTGGAGFIGSTIVDFYIKAGHQVWVVDDESTGCAEQVNPAANYHRIDIRDKKAMAALFHENRFDVVNHHAAQIDVRLSVQDPVADADINIKGFLTVLDLAQKNKVRKIIFSSSGGTIYGECKKPAREGDPEVPLSPYGVAKLATEKYIQAYAALYGMKYTIFRYSNVYGPRQDPRGEAGVISIFTDRFLNDENAFIFGNGRQTRDFVFVEDVARANVAALNKGDNEIINIGTAHEISVNELYKVMSVIFNEKKPAIYKPARAGELKRSVLSFKKATKVLGWKPQVKINDGLKATVNYFRKLRPENA